MGSRPRLFREHIAWDCYIANPGVIHCSHRPHETQINIFVDALNTKLGNYWKDLHAFSCMSNLAYQTTRKLSPDIYNEMMISVLYRLMSLSFEKASLEEAIRIALLTFSSTIFLTSSYMTQPYERPFNIFSRALFSLCQSTNAVVPPAVMLWLLLLYHLVAYEEPRPQDWQIIWLRKAVLIAGMKGWNDAHTLVRSVMWVDFVHDLPGKKAYKTAVQRQENLAECDLVGHASLS